MKAIYQIRQNLNRKYQKSIEVTLKYPSYKNQNNNSLTQ